MTKIHIILDILHRKQPTAAHSSTGEKSISLGFKQPAGLSKAKRDVEQEADSANGKTPLYLFKKDFYHPNTMRFLTSSFTNGNGKGERRKGQRSFVHRKLSQIFWKFGMNDMEGIVRNLV